MNYAEFNRKTLSKDNYVLKASKENNYWFGISETKLQEFLLKNGVHFNIIIYGSSQEADFYVIPYDIVASMLTRETLTNSKEQRNRWIGDIRFHQLSIRNCGTPIDISKYYGNRFMINGDAITDEEENDYSIYNRRIEISARLRQSKFRKRVLKNYGGKCCITGISTKELLIASHIIPWADRIDSRLDPSNGLSLFVLFDNLFDKGFISVSDDFKIIGSKELNTNSDLVAFVNPYIDTKISLPNMNSPKLEYLEYHRQKIFRGA